jgi:circadian clock protein KaiB
MAGIGQTARDQPEHADAQAAQAMEFVFHLYIAGANPRSLRAVENIRRLCEEHLRGHYDLQVIDIYQSPAVAEEGQVVAAPTLVRYLPGPLRRIVGDLSDEGRVLMAFGVRRPE